MGRLGCWMRSSFGCRCLLRRRLGDGLLGRGTLGSVLLLVRYVISILVVVVVACGMVCMVWRR